MIRSAKGFKRHEHHARVGCIGEGCAIEGLRMSRYARHQVATGGFFDASADDGIGALQARTRRQM